MYFELNNMKKLLVLFFVTAFLWMSTSSYAHAGCDIYIDYPYYSSGKKHVGSGIDCSANYAGAGALLLVFEEDW